jgi:hypothetical protein
MSRIKQVDLTITATDEDGCVVACPPIDQLRAALTLAKNAFAALPEAQRAVFVEGAAAILGKLVPAPAAPGPALFELQILQRGEHGEIVAVEKMTTPSRETYDKRRSELLTFS